MATPKSSSSSTTTADGSKSSKISAAVQHLDTISNVKVEKDLENVLETVKTLDILCAYTKCKMKTNLMGQNCEFCRERYCFKHGLPEIHGCGEAIRKDERKKFLHPEPAKTIRQREDLAKAKTRLHVKLKDMSISRKQKQPNGNKSKK